MSTFRLPYSNLDRLDRHVVPIKADGGYAGRAEPILALPLKGLPQKPRSEYRGALLGEAVPLKAKGGQVYHPQEKLMMAKGKKFHY